MKITFRLFSFSEDFAPYNYSLLTLNKTLAKIIIKQLIKEYFTITKLEEIFP